MNNEGKQQNCAICGKRLGFWNTQLKKYKGKKICTSCAWKIARQEMDKTRMEQKTKIEAQKINEAGKKIEEVGNKFIRLGLKLTIRLTIPLILFIIGLFTFPIGILFWLLAVGLVVSYLRKNKG